MLFSALILAAGSFTPSQSSAQRPDTAKTRGPNVIIRGATPDSQSVDTPSVIRISPRRAFLTSLVAPGYMQLRFGRPKAATIFLAAEAATIGMSIKSKRDLNIAKAAKQDTVVTLIFDDAGKPVIDPVTMKQKFTSTPRNQNIAGRLTARRAHFEDWVAGLVFNHLVAGADAFVAANLADFNTNVRVTSAGGRGVNIFASVAW